mmetsp:Transcript_32902/g.94950  ORF Transcript_32902/g.94950 Transcript_32902/m.94950 type:complete len:209 (-) Transcript_32902:2158-2784(-)
MHSLDDLRQVPLRHLNMESAVMSVLCGSCQCPVHGPRPRQTLIERTPTVREVPQGPPAVNSTTQVGHDDGRPCRPFGGVVAHNGQVPQPQRPLLGHEGGGPDERQCRCEGYHLYAVDGRRVAAEPRAVRHLVLQKHSRHLVLPVGGGVVGIAVAEQEIRRHAHFLYGHHGSGQQRHARRIHDATPQVKPVQVVDPLRHRFLVLTVSSG